MKIHGTAKGAALSTKDFGVAFGGAAVAVTCQTADGSDDNFLGQDAPGGHEILRIAMVPDSDNAFIGEQTASLAFALKAASGASNSETGNYTCKVYDTNFTSVLATSDTILDSADLTASFENKKFEFASDLTITAGKYYAITTSGTNNWSDNPRVGVEPQFSSGETVTGNNSSWYTAESGTITKTKTMSFCIYV